jgi:cytidyltransferase-like protein
MTKKKGIIVSGYFNPIHKGHIEYFNNAKALADEFFVIVNNDLLIDQEKLIKKERIKLFVKLSNCLFAKKKSVWDQLFAFCILISITDFGISNLHGFFAINSLPITLSIVLSIFLIISMVSAFDIIAGIASITGISIAALNNNIGIELMPFSTDERFHSLNFTS